LRNQIVFEDLVSCILDMQIRFRGKAVRYKRLKALLKGSLIDYENLFSIGDSGIQLLKISRQKYTALVNLCLFWEENGMDDYDWESKKDEEIRVVLGKIKGIGNWTIDMILMFSLQRPDIFPVDDYQLKRVMTAQFDLRNDKSLKAEMLAIAEEWRPNRSKIVIQLLNQNSTY
jgi:DNA-3-methyladenine glycosylase II